ncbi:MAG: putative outer membrane protein [Bacteroidetes bacterium]|nr:putative outer membrane protein [Bacteroidota bacterium]
MKFNLTLIAIAGLSLTACNNKPTADIPVSTIDTVSHTQDSASNQTNMDQSRVVKEDSSFLATASETGVFEIEAAKLAQKNSTDAGVKEFATMMTAEHTAMGKDVEALAKTKNVILPVGMGDDNKKEWDKLLDLRGAKFDKEYVSANVKGHKDAIALFEKTTKNTDNSTEVRDLATKGLPTLKKHKQHADALKDKMKM